MARMLIKDLSKAATEPPTKGVAMKAEAVLKKDEKDARESVKCINCERMLKDPSEGVRSGKSVMCVSCYESLLNPFPKCCTGGAAM
jgi:hypothetical protein